ncbi:MAG: metal-sensitive transcriptional regulator [Alphaproteobacteria bacterium]|nr:metal-sensitive transcriptional regulator [Alphaproteobacteria bacterium]
MQHKSHEECVSRLRKIEGQVRGVTRMIEDERYCIDILTQIHAVKAALAKVESEILKGHVETCVENAINSGDAAEQRQKFAELVDVLGKYRP